MAHTAQAPQITKQDATPSERINSKQHGGAVRSTIGVFTSAQFVAGTVGQTYAFCRIPARARLVGVHAYGGAASSGSVKVGLFRTNDGIAISDGCITAAVNLATDVYGANVMNVVPTVDPSLSVKEVFSTAVGTAGATEDVEYDIVATVVTVANAGSMYALEARYVLPD